MSRNEDFDNSFWGDPEVEELSPNATLLYVWSWTNPRCGMAGMYRVSHRGMTESKLSLEEIPTALAELTEARFLFYEDQVLWVRSRVKRLRSKSPQIAKAVAKDLERVPASNPLRCRFIALYGSQPWLKDALPKGSLRPIDDPSEKPIGKGDSDGSSGTPLGVPLSGAGSLSGTTTNDEGEENSAWDSVPKLPAGFPTELVPHLDAVEPVLVDLAERHGAAAVKRMALASVVAARPRKPLVRAARDFAGWADGQAQKRRDVIAGYRNWLDKTNDLAAIERLDSEQPAARDNNFSIYDRAAGL